MFLYSTGILYSVGIAPFGNDGSWSSVSFSSRNILLVFLPKKHPDKFSADECFFMIPTPFWFSVSEVSCCQYRMWIAEIVSEVSSSTRQFGHALAKQSLSNLERQLSKTEVVLNSRWLILAIGKNLPFENCAAECGVTVMCKKVTCVEESMWQHNHHLKEKQNRVKCS